MASKTLICPYCGSDKIYAVGRTKKGFSTKKAIVGGLLTGGIGLIAGFAGKSGKMEYCCKKCNRSFTKPKTK